MMMPTFSFNILYVCDLLMCIQGKILLPSLAMEKYNRLHDQGMVIKIFVCSSSEIYFFSLSHTRNIHSVYSTFFYTLANFRKETVLSRSVAVQMCDSKRIPDEQFIAMYDNANPVLPYMWTVRFRAIHMGIVHEIRHVYSDAIFVVSRMKCYNVK